MFGGFLIYECIFKDLCGMGIHCVHMYFATYFKKILSPKAFLNHIDVLPTHFLALGLVLIAETYRRQKLWTAKNNMRNS